MSHLKRTVLSEERKILKDPSGKRRASGPPALCSCPGVTGAPGQCDPWLLGSSPGHLGDFSVLFGFSLDPTVILAAHFLKTPAVCTPASTPTFVVPNISSGGSLSAEKSPGPLRGVRKDCVYFQSDSAESAGSRYRDGSRSLAPCALPKCRCTRELT